MEAEATLEEEDTSVASGKYLHIDRSDFASQQGGAKGAVPKGIAPWALTPLGGKSAVFLSNQAALRGSPRWPAGESLRGVDYQLEARAGIEPAYRSFADSGLTTWLPRLADLGIALFKTYPPRTFKTFFRAGGGRSTASRSPVGALTRFKMDVAPMPFGCLVLVGFKEGKGTGGARRLVLTFSFIFFIAICPDLSPSDC